MYKYIFFPFDLKIYFLPKLLVCIKADNDRDFYEHKGDYVNAQKCINIVADYEDKHDIAEEMDKDYEKFSKYDLQQVREYYVKKREYYLQVGCDSNRAHLASDIISYIERITGFSDE